MAVSVPKLTPGRYVVAVSGGIDSVVLLDFLTKQTGLELIVAHFDHGVRPDSAADAQFVGELAKRYGLTYIHDRVKLGSGASEEKARRLRYGFLDRVRTDSGAVAIVTAHHQDDLLETAIINLLRGTGWRGIASLRETPTIRRPLLGMTRNEIRAYADQQKLLWHEDSTNQDTNYLRNYVRRRLLPFAVKQDPGFQRSLAAHINAQLQLRAVIEASLERLFDGLVTVGESSFSLPRTRLIMLPNAVSSELLYYGITKLTGAGERRPNLARALHFIKTARLYKTHQLSKQVAIIVKKGTVVVYRRSF